MISISTVHMFNVIGLNFLSVLPRIKFIKNLERCLEFSTNDLYFHCVCDVSQNAEGVKETYFMHKEHNRAQFHKACKHKNLLSTEKYCLAKTGYLPTLHEVNIVATGTPIISC